MSDNRQLVSTHVHSKELSLLVDGIVNWPRDRQKRLKLAVREIEIRELIDQNGKYYRYHNSNREPNSPHFYYNESPCSLNKPIVVTDCNS